jgi:SAM-dependent methyltransferase
MLRQATRRNAAAVRAERVDLRLGSAEELPDFGAPFDAILAVNSLMFWDDPGARLKALRDLLRPGGRIAIAYQPRGPGSTNETARHAAAELTEHFAAVGFTDMRTETLPLKPTMVVCVVGVR